MVRKLSVLLLAAGCGSFAAGDWLTIQGDPLRSGWAHAETRISPATAKSLSLLWKAKLDTVPKELDYLTTPLVVDSFFTPKGVKDLVVIAGASDDVFVLEADSGKVFWKKHLAAEGAPKNTPHWLCPYALNATPVVERSRALGSSVYVLSSDGRLHALNLVNGEDRFPPVQFVPPYSKTWSLNLVGDILYTALASNCDGARSAVYSIDIRKPDRPIHHFQTTTSAGAGIWGRTGVAVDSQGFVYAETGDGPYDIAAGKFSDTVLKLTSGELKLADYYTPSNREFLTRKDLDMGSISPVVFPFKKGELIAASGKEGVIYLLDAKTPGGSDHRTPLYRSPMLANDDVDFAGRGFWGAMASWEDRKGGRWLYAPAYGPKSTKAPPFPASHGEAPNGSIMAFQVEETDGKPVLTPRWISRDLNMPEPPVVANGVVFALASGENTRQQAEDGHLMNSAERVKSAPGNAVLYAFDSATGEELFSSGKTMPGITHFGGIAVSSGRIYVTTYDCQLYVFGVPE